MQDDKALIAHLDEIRRVEIDAMPFGIILVDESGTIFLYNAVQARLSGHPQDEAIGRNFFYDIAPNTNLPCFYGRFIEGVRRGQLNECFLFTFGFATQPLRVEAHLSAAKAPGRYWIVIRPISTLTPNSYRSAALAVAAVERRVRSEPVDASICEREPIHIPGAVQPHAVMLACDPESLIVEACSDNVSDVFEGEGCTSIIGGPLDALMPADLISMLREAMVAGDLDDPTRPARHRVRMGLAAAPYEMTMHLHDERLVLEMERVAENPQDFNSASPFQAQDAVLELRKAPDLAATAQVTAIEIRRMTGFERILIYRFDAEWSGEAVAEDKAAALENSLFGLRFPASDIPAQARALYAKTVSRFIVDRDAISAAVMGEPEADNQAVDLTYTQSRAMSPIHLEYQRNLGVNGSMSVSIMVEGKLWGLVIGHHRQPHYVTPETRALVSLVTDAFALRVYELESVRSWREQQATLAAQNQLLQCIAASDDFVAVLTGKEGTTSLLDLFGATGAAVINGDHVETIGVAPDDAALLELSSWLRRDLAPGTQIFSTHQLCQNYVPAACWRETTSGLLAAFVGEGAGSRDYLLLWFRPEVASTVIWGGNPNKTVLADAETRVVLPRRSFERWVEERRGQAEPWAPWQLSTAEALTAAIDGVMLRQGRRITELTVQQGALTRALEQKDILAREIDHRVKNSLQIVAGVMLMQSRSVSDPAAKAAFEDTYARVMSIARVHESLHQSDDVESVDLGATLRQLCGDLAAGMTGAEQRLDISAEAGLMVSSQAAVALSLVATELVTNALKYAYEPGEAGRITVSVTARPAGGVELSVRDSGKGLPLDWSNRPKKAGGRGGLGMRIITAMLQQIGAEMNVDSELGGACFTISA